MGEEIPKAASDLMNTLVAGWGYGLESLTRNSSNTTPAIAKTDHENMEILKTNLNAMFLVIMGAMIIFMQAGFGFLEAGSIRSKNTTNILIKNFADLSFGMLNSDCRIF